MSAQQVQPSSAPGLARMTPVVLPAADGPVRPQVADMASFLQHVRQGVQGWVAAAVEAATNDLGSSAQVHSVAGGREHTATALAVLRHKGAELVRRITQGVLAQLDMADSRQGTQGSPSASSSDQVAQDQLILELIDDAQIAQEIETARIVTLIASEAEAELQQLNALCSGMRKLGQVDPEAAPLQPARCARGLRGALAGWPEPAPTRLLLLRVLGTAVGKQMRSVYADQERLLSSWRVRPAEYRIRPTVSARAAPMPNAMADDEWSQPDAGASMRELADRARAAPTPMPAPSEPGSGLTFRPLGEPVRQSELRSAALPALASQQLMGRLFEQLATPQAQPAGAGSLIDGLKQVGQRLAETDTRLWEDPAHPWWQLVDSLLAAQSLRDALPAQHQQVLGDSLLRVIERLRLPAPEATGLVPKVMTETAEAVRDLSSRFIEEQASDWIEPVRVQHRQADRESLESALRQQILQQLLGTRVPSSLRRFLLGPWTMAMVEVAAMHGQGSPELADMAFTVDDLTRATTRPGTRISRAQRLVLLRQVQVGLMQAGLPESRVEAERAELESLLGRPAETIADAAATDDVAEGPETFEHAAAPEWSALPSMPMELHAALPTVPMEMGVDGAAAPERSPEAWAATLRPTGFCRLFLQGRWMTAQLLWISEGGNLFLFKSRHGGRSHSLTRRMLAKLRAAGLATAIEDGHLVAQALNSLVASERGAG